MKRKSVIYSIISISALGIIAKVVGLFREGVVAAYFGTSAQMDVFGLLSGYATMLVAVIAGALAISFSPYYIKDIQQEGESWAADRFSHTLNQYIFFALVFCFYIIYIFIMQYDWLTSAEMWAETATNYYANADSGNILKMLFATDSGYWNIP